MLAEEKEVLFEPALEFYGPSDAAAKAWEELFPGN